MAKGRRQEPINTYHKLAQELCYDDEYIKQLETITEPDKASRILEAARIKSIKTDMDNKTKKRKKWIE